MTITEILDKACVLVPLEAADKTEAIRKLVDSLHENGKLADRDDVLQAVLEREQIRSTGIGEGLAVPHGKARGCDGLRLAIGKPAKPIDFGSKDGRPCEMIFLLTSPVNEMGPHIQALARISRIWLSPAFRRAAAGAESADELYAAIQEHQS
jgi:mannitol/fructose-specific phosphotransferase system IIA component (Ntr-type)